MKFVRLVLGQCRAVVCKFQKKIARPPTTQEHTAMPSAASSVVTSAIMPAKYIARSFVMTFKERNKRVGGITISEWRNRPLRSMDTIHNHSMEWPSRWCHDAILLARQLSKLGNTSLYVGMLAGKTLAIPSPGRKKSGSSKLEILIALLCFPFTFGAQTPLFWEVGVFMLLSCDWNCLTLTRIFSHHCRLFWEFSERSSKSLSESATKSFTLSCVISEAHCAACSLKNWETLRSKISKSEAVTLSKLLKKDIYPHNLVPCTPCFGMLQPLFMSLKSRFAREGLWCDKNKTWE